LLLVAPELPLDPLVVRRVDHRLEHLEHVRLHRMRVLDVVDELLLQLVL